VAQPIEHRSRQIRRRFPGKGIGIRSPCGDRYGAFDRVDAGGEFSVGEQQVRLTQPGACLIDGRRSRGQVHHLRALLPRLRALTLRQQRFEDFASQRGRRFVHCIRQGCLRLAELLHGFRQVP
jgi:hypothetical protein